MLGIIYFFRLSKPRYTIINDEVAIPKKLMIGCVITAREKLAIANQGLFLRTMVMPIILRLAAIV